MQGFQAARARQPHVEQHGVGAGAVEQPVGLLCVVCNVGGVADSLGYVAAALADGPLIIDDEQVQQVRLRFVASGFHS